MSLFIVRGPDGDRSVNVEKEVVSIGRAEENDIRVLAPESSRHHCQVMRLDEGWKLIDLGSRNGTQVNGVRTAQKVLEAGDEISIGSSKIFFERVSEGISLPEVGEGSSHSPLPTSASRSSTHVPVGHSDPTGTRPGARGAALPESASNDADDRAGATTSISLDERSSATPSTPPLAADELAAYRRLLELNQALNSDLDLRKLLERILDAAISVTGAERGFVILREGEALNVKAARNLDREAVKRAEAKISRSVLREVLVEGKTLSIDDAGRDGRFRKATSVVDLHLAAILAAPLRTRDGVIGAVYLDHRFKRESFSDTHKALLEIVAGQAAIAVSHARLLDESRSRAEALEQAKKELQELSAALRAKVQSQESELAVARERLVEEGAETPLKHDYSAIVTRSPRMREVLSLVDRVAESTVAVLIQGESGTGKELIARALHMHGPRRTRPFVAQNCAAIPAPLIESELFGHVRGAFTGAEREKPGLFEQAHGGTLFLDEIGDMEFSMQAKLLRVLQDGEMRRVGAQESRKVDVRLLTATHRDLEALCRAGRFREDLYYRIAVVKIELPALRERPEDIPMLARHFAERAATRVGARRERRELSEAALVLLARYGWPGNVRELENEIERAMALSSGAIEPAHLSPDVRKGDARRLHPSARPATAAGRGGRADSRGGTAAARGSLSPTRAGPSDARAGGADDHAVASLEKGSAPSPRELRAAVTHAQEEAEREAVLAALRRAGWKKVEAAAILGISRPTLDAKIEKYGLRKNGAT